MTMKQITTLIIPLLLGVGLTGCYGQTISNAVPSLSQIGIENGRGLIEEITLSQAQTKVSFKILTPTYLPNGMTFQSSYLGDGTPFVSQPAGKVVVLNYQTPDHKNGFVVVEQVGVMGHLYDGVIKKISLTNKPAEVGIIEKQFETTVLFAIGNVVCRVYSDDKNIGEQELTQIANSFQ